jgi:hypothetical protein
MTHAPVDQWPPRIRVVQVRPSQQHIPNGRAAYHKYQLERSIEEFGPPPSEMWLVSGNIVPIRVFGPGDAELRRGLRLFRGDARVTIVRFWRNASPRKVTVVGRHRHDNTYKSSIIDTCFIYNLRVQLVRSPFVISQHWEHPQQRLNYGRDKQAAEVVLTELQVCAAGEGTRG